MGPLRKQPDEMTIGATYSYVSDGLGFHQATPVARAFPEEAFGYEGDISAETVKKLQDRADVFLNEGDWEVIDGYVGGQ